MATRFPILEMNGTRFAPAYAMSIHKSRAQLWSRLLASAWSATSSTLPSLRQKQLRTSGLWLCNQVNIVGTARKTYLIERFSDLTESSEEANKPIFEPANQTDSQQSHILTKRKLGPVSSYDWISQDDLSRVFRKIKIRKPTDSVGFIFQIIYCCSALWSTTAFFDCDIVVFLNISAESVSFVLEQLPCCSLQ